MPTRSGPLEGKQIAWATGWVAIANVAVLAVIYAREATTAFLFGTSVQLDAFLIAFSVLYFVYTVCFGPLPRVLPALLLDKRSGNRTPEQMAFGVFLVISVATLAIMAIAWSCAEWLVQMIAPGFDPETANLSARLLRISVPMLGFVLLSRMASGFLNSQKLFIIPALAPILFNATAIAVVLCTYSTLGVLSLALGVLAGSVVEAIAPLIALASKGFAIPRLMGPQKEDVVGLSLLLLPTIISQGANQAFVFVDRFLASHLEAGSIAALAFADKVTRTSTLILAGALTMVLIPYVANAHRKSDPEHVATVTIRACRMIIFILTPLQIVLLTSNVPITRLLFQRGAFDIQATGTTARVMQAYSWQVVLIALRAVMGAVFLGTGDARSMAVAALVGLAMGTIAKFLLVASLGVVGIALGGFAGLALECCLLLLVLRSKFLSLDSDFWLYAGKAALAGIGMYACAALVRVGASSWASLLGNRTADVLTLAAVAILGCCVYLLLARVLRLEEVGYVGDVLKTSARRLLSFRSA